MAFDNSTPSPVELVNVEFEVEKEGWNTYELKDGTVIKGRMIVNRIAKPKNAPAGQVGLNTQNIFTTFAPPEKRGKPAVSKPIDQINKSDMYVVEVQHSDEVWNVYRLLNSGDRIKVKMVYSEIYRVKDAFDSLGEPYFIVTSGMMITPVGKTIES